GPDIRPSKISIDYAATYRRSSAVKDRDRLGLASSPDSQRWDQPPCGRLDRTRIVPQVVQNVNAAVHAPGLSCQVAQKVIARSGLDDDDDIRIGVDNPVNKDPSEERRHVVSVAPGVWGTLIPGIVDLVDSKPLQIPNYDLGH